MKREVLAFVKDKEITNLDIDNVINKYSVAERKNMDTDDERKKILDQLISCEIMYNYAKDEMLYETEEFKTRMAEAKKDILTQMGIANAVGKVNINDEKAMEYYNTNIEKFKIGDMVSAKHILVETEEEAVRIKEEIENSEISFSEAALKYSMCPSNMNGGSIGTFGRGKMVLPFEEAAFAAKVNKITDPVKTEFGFHIILVENFKKGYIKEFKDVKEDIIINLKMKYELNNYKDVLRKMKTKYYSDNI